MTQLAIKNLAIVFQVKDLERTRRFYAESLGIQINVEEGYASAIIPGGTELVFFEGEPQIGTSPQIVFGLEQGGIDQIATDLAARGVPLLTPVTEAPGGWSVEFKDPDHHLLSLYQEASLPR